MERLPYIVVLAAYALVTVGYLLPDLLGARLTANLRRVTLIGAAIHGITLLGGLWFAPWGFGFPEALSATSLAVILAYGWVGTGRLRSLGMLLVPLALVLLGTAMVVPHRQVNALEVAGVSAWLPVHLGLIFSGTAGFALSGAVGVVYLWARAQLKKKRFSGMGRLPSLEVLDRVQFRAMLFGFLFLTLGIGVGGAWAALTLQEPWTVDPKVWFTLMIWFWYGVALQLRLIGGRRGRWTALFSIVGFAGMIFSMIGINFLMVGWHTYGG